MFYSIRFFKYALYLFSTINIKPSYCLYFLIFLQFIIADTVPSITYGDYNSSISADTSVGYPLVTFNLTDLDQGDVITYSLNHSYFTVDESTSWYF